MACRLRNTGKHPLRVDLRGDQTVVLGAGETSPPLREELLYGNTFVAEWEARGVVKRLPAKMAEVLEREKQRAAPRPRPEAKDAPARPAPAEAAAHEAWAAGAAPGERPNEDPDEKPAGEPARDDD